MAEVLQWSREKKLQLRTEKCVVSFFSTDPHEANWIPIMVVEGKQLEFLANPVFLGITYDRMLKHVEALARGAPVPNVDKMKKKRKKSLKMSLDCNETFTIIPTMWN